ncbi:MAG: hypothetical protein PWQ37_407 [Candidatus Petromonas sp.]|jgi:hypothetical protein|nr:hypothetical protein [Candidatus Petromonas sp.]
MSIYKKNALNQLKDTFEILLDEYRENLSQDEVFKMAKEYEIRVWKEQMESYKLIKIEDESRDIKNAIKICKSMIKELSKISMNEVLSTWY